MLQDENTRMALTLARHQNAQDYWGGGNYELNLTFDTLRDKQWPQVLEALWEHPALDGPLAGRYSPAHEVARRSAIQPLPPTATLIQHAQLQVDGLLVGCDVQATRSLFECVSVLVPLGMFEGIVGGPEARQKYPELETLDAVFYDIAMHVYDTVAFRVAVIGFERACQLPAELVADGELRHNFLVMGNFLAQDDVLQTIEPDVTQYQEVRPALRWKPARQA